MIVFISILLILFLRLCIRFKKQLSPTNIILEIIPPSDTKQTTLTTEKLITNLHEIQQNRSFVDRLLVKKNTFSQAEILYLKKGEDNENK